MQILCTQCGKYKKLENFFRSEEHVYNCLECFNKNLNESYKKEKIDLIKELKAQGRLKE
jgi:hypothetical protein